ncbi:unnamed protein product [Calypogeia fissa]
MDTLAISRNTVGVVEPVARTPKCRDGFDQTRVAVSCNRQLWRSGRRQVSFESRVHVEEPSGSSFARPEITCLKVLQDLQFQNVGKIDQPADKISAASHVSSTDGNLGTPLDTALRHYFNEVTTGCARILKDPNPARALGEHDLLDDVQRLPRCYFVILLHRS